MFCYSIERFTIQEGDMPMEELLAMYGYANGAAPPEASETHDSRSSSEEEIIINQDLTLDKDQVAQDLLRDDEDSNKETSATDLLKYVKIPSHTARLLRCEFTTDPYNVISWVHALQV